MCHGLQKRCQKASCRATQRIAAIKTVGEEAPVVGIATKRNLAAYQRKQPAHKIVIGLRGQTAMLVVLVTFVTPGEWTPSAWRAAFELGSQTVASE